MAAQFALAIHRAQQQRHIFLTFRYRAKPAPTPYFPCNPPLPERLSAATVPHRL